MWIGEEKFETVISKRHSRCFCTGYFANHEAGMKKERARFNDATSSSRLCLLDRLLPHRHLLSSLYTTMRALLQISTAARLLLPELLMEFRLEVNRAPCRRRVMSLTSFQEISKYLVLDCKRFLGAYLIPAPLHAIAGYGVEKLQTSLYVRLKATIVRSASQCTL